MTTGRAGRGRALLADAVRAVERVDQGARGAAGGDQRRRARAGELKPELAVVRCLALELIADEVDDLGGHDLLEAAQVLVNLERVGDEAVDRDDRGEQRHDRDDREQRRAGGEDRHLAEQRFARARIQRAGERSLVRHQCCQRSRRLITMRSYTSHVIDTHCHLDLAAFDADRDEVLARAAAAGVDGHAGAGDPAARRGRRCVALAARTPRRDRARHSSAGRAGPRPDERPDADAIARAASEAGASRSASAGSTAPPASTSSQEALFRAHIRAARAREAAARGSRVARARCARRGSCARSARTRSAA